MDLVRRIIKTIQAQKNINMRFLLVFLVVYCCLIQANATAVQKPVDTKTVLLKKSTVLQIDSSKVKLRKFDENAIQDYKTQRDFIYDDVAPEALSWWDRLLNWLWKLINSAFAGKTSGSIIKIILVVLVIAVIAFVVIKLIGLDFKLFTRKSKTLDIPYEESLENIHEISFDEEIENALQHKNYRLAVRLLYLKTLKHLSDRELIDWQLEKTNQTYVLELQNEKHRVEFNELTQQFEYIWYGEFFIDQAMFDPINQSFQQFNQQTT